MFLNLLYVINVCLFYVYRNNTVYSVNEVINKTHYKKISYGRNGGYKTLNNTYLLYTIIYALKLNNQKIKLLKM